ncbi:RNA polymerase sigma factor [Devosia lacusdianchii]|jgi:RNA polymerase sigma-70 factor (ECF subfamily)|uniref:RNA polymerase sigma factor n=1 Tax=Devosia lacusdianchii TaxID=2917991 RepID=UPI001F063939|nr:RNA polymerase sigma factor [Devosia sp. JXJ CY 41]
MITIGPSLIQMLPRLRRYAITLCRMADVADELVQIACEKALASPGRGADVPFEAWMFRILRNAWIDRMRRLRTRGEEIDVYERDDLSAFDGAAIPEQRLMLNKTMQAIARLPEDQRELLLLVCVEELSYRDAAEILDLPIGTVMSRLARARRKLAEDVGLEGGRLL